MKKEQRKMNLETYRKCDEIRQEVLIARNGKKVRKQDYPAAVVSCA
jgi:ribosomal protein L19